MKMKKYNLKATLEAVLKATCLGGLLLYGSQTWAQTISENSPITEPSKQINRLTSHSTLFGIGRINVLDTYLSPFEYEGLQGNVVFEKFRPTHWCDGRITTQQKTEAHVGYSKNATQTANMLSATLSYKLAWHYSWTVVSSLKLFAGGGIQVAGGGIYNTRNGNNPAQALARTALYASGIASYPFHIKKQPFQLRYQIDMPLCGAMFSPNYNQSYYEIFTLGNYDHNVRFTHPGNAPVFYQTVTLDFPIKGFTFRLGYGCDMEQSNVNGIKNHIYKHSFLIGYVKDFYFVKRKEVTKKTVPNF